MKLNKRELFIVKAVIEIFVNQCNDTIDEYRKFAMNKFIDSDPQIVTLLTHLDKEDLEKIKTHFITHLDTLDVDLVEDDLDCWTCVNYGNDMYEDDEGHWQSLCEMCRAYKDGEL